MHEWVLDGSARGALRKVNVQPHLPPGGDALEVRCREPPLHGSGWWLGPGVELSLNPRVWSIGSRLRGYLMSAPAHLGNKLRLDADTQH